MSSTENTICRNSYQQQDSPFTLNSYFKIKMDYRK